MQWCTQFNSWPVVLHVLIGGGRVISGISFTAYPRISIVDTQNLRKMLPCMLLVLFMLYLCLSHDVKLVRRTRGSVLINKFRLPPPQNCAKIDHICAQFEDIEGSGLMGECSMHKAMAKRYS